MGLFSSIFGGGTSKASEESQAAQKAANLATERFIREQTGLAREDVKELFPIGQEFREKGFAGALELIGAGVDPTISAFREGNVGAQRAIASALPDIRSALLGLPTDLSGFEPTSIDIDESFLSRLGRGAAALEPEPEPATFAVPPPTDRIRQRIPTPFIRGPFQRVPDISFGGGALGDIGRGRSFAGREFR